MILKYFDFKLNANREEKQQKQIDK